MPVRPMPLRPATAAGVCGAAAVTALTVMLAGLVATPAPAQRDEARLAEASEGQQLYEANCAACHGAGGDGSGVGPDLGGVVERLGRQEVAAAIRDGRDASPSMPAFGAQLTGAQIEALVSHVATFDAGGAAASDTGQGGDEPAGGDSSGGSVALLLGLAGLALLVAGGVWLVRGGGSAEG